MRWSKLCHPTSFSLNLRTVQSMPVNRLLQGLHLGAQEVLALTANIRLHGQEPPPGVFSLIDRLHTQHPSQNKVQQGLQLGLQTRHRSHPMGSRHLVIIKKNPKRSHQRLYRRLPSILPRMHSRNHALVQRPGEQRTVRSHIYCISPMMASLGSSHCHHSDYPHSRQPSKLLWNRLSNRTPNSSRTRSKDTRNSLKMRPLP